MIICHEHKFIFIKTQKTASTSLEIALSKYCGPMDVLTPITASDQVYRQELGYQGPMNFKLPFKEYSFIDWMNFVKTGKRKKFYNHISCLEIQKHVKENVYKDYYKFCFERNPYDKAISLFFHEGGYHKWSSILEFINSGGLDVIKGYDQYTVENVVAVDDIFKYEYLNEALVEISRKLNLREVIELPKVKLKSQFRKDKRGYKEILTQEEKELIDVQWKREIDLLQYEY